MSRSTSPVRVNFTSDSDGEEMNSEHHLNELSTKIVNDVLPPEKESDLAPSVGGTTAEIKHSADELSQKAQETLDNLKDKASEVLTHLKEYSGTHESSTHEPGDLNNDLIEGLKSLAEKAQDKADEVSEWADKKLDEVKAEFDKDSNSPTKDEDNTVLGDLRESIGKAEQKFEEIVEKAKDVIVEKSPSPAEDKSSEEHFIQTTEHEMHEHRPSPEDLSAEEKHGSQVELPVINDPIEGIAGVISTPIVPVVIDDKEPEVLAIDGRELGSQDTEHLIVEEDIHKHAASEPIDSSNNVSDSESKSKESSEQPEEVPLETYDEPEPQKDFPIDEEIIHDNVKEEENEITQNDNPVTTIAFDDQALHDEAPVIQIETDETLPPLEIPKQIIVEDVDVTGNFEADKEKERSISPPQIASQEYSIISHNSSTSSSENDKHRQPSPPIYSEEKEATPGSADIPVIVEDAIKEVSPMQEPSHVAAFTKDSVPIQIEDHNDLPPLDLEKEPSPEIKEQSHREIFIDNTASAAKEAEIVPQIPPPRPSPPAVIEHIEDKAKEDVIVPKIVAHETKIEETTKTSATHVRPIDITPLPEDEPIPVGIPEVRTIETVKEEREKLEKKTGHTSTSSGASAAEEDDKDKAAGVKETPPKRAETFLNNVKRRCIIL